MGVQHYSSGAVKMFCFYQCDRVQTPILLHVTANHFSCAPALFDCDYDMDHVSEKKHCYYYQETRDARTFHYDLLAAINMNHGCQQEQIKALAFYRLSRNQLTGLCLHLFVMIQTCTYLC